jgi:hypothetical protein
VTERRRSVDFGGLTSRALGEWQRRRQYEAATPLILNKHGDVTHQHPMGRFNEYGDGSLSNGMVSYEPAQIPTYFRTMTANDRRKLARFNERVRALEAERRAFLNEAWERGTPLATSAAQAAARKRKASVGDR